LPAELIVEDGTGVPAANSYADQDQAAIYHENVGTIEDWQPLMDAGVDAGMLIQATQAIEAQYTWAWRILTTTQGLGLPRQDLTQRDGRVITSAAQVALAAEAVAWLALRLHGNQSATGLTGAVSESLGSWSVTYGSAGGAKPDYSPLDKMLAPLITGGGFRTFSSGATVRWS
jgi:hypothetical protein